MVILLIIIGAGVWYIAVYDTARGRCERGDLSACITAVAQQSPGPVNGNGGGTETDPDALRALSLAQQYDDVCRLTLPPHEVMVWVAGQGAQALCHRYVTQGLVGYNDWHDDLWGGNDAWRKICATDRSATLEIVVLDTGLGVLGQAVCSEFGA